LNFIIYKNGKQIKTFSLNELKKEYILPGNCLYIKNTVPPIANAALWEEVKIKNDKNNFLRKK
jgi:hypothetical protein